MCSLEHDQTIRAVAKRYHPKIDISSYMIIDDAIEMYNQAWGHSVGASLGFFTEIINLLEVDSDLKDSYLKYMEHQRKRRVKNVHIKK